VSVRTNWSWFIHPWKKQIDFIIGKHVVLSEPANKNIFEESKTTGLFDSKPSLTAQSMFAGNTYNMESNNSNVSSSEVVSSKNMTSFAKSSLNDMISFGDGKKMDYIKKVEKDIVEYISRVREK
jgi:hypothetical protein